MYESNGKTRKAAASAAAGSVLKIDTASGKKLGTELEKAFYGAMQKHHVALQREKAAVSKASFDISAGGLIAEYLKCPFSSLSTYKVKFTGPVSMVYKANMVRFFETSFEDRSGEMAEYFEKHLKAAYQETNPSGLTNMQKAVGYSYNGVLDLPDGGVVGLPSQGLGFYRDSDGYPFAVHYPMAMQFPNMPPGLEFEIACSGMDSKALKKVSSIIKRYTHFVRENPLLTRGVYNMNGKAVRYEKIDWSELKISPELKAKIDFHIVDYVKRIRKLKNSGIRNNRGIILCGKPGTGKTLLGRILAASVEVPFIMLNARDLLINAAQRLHELYEFADLLAPVIIYIEDGDVYLGDRMNSGNSALLSEFLNKIDGIQQNRGVVTIVTANNPELLDEAVKNRPRRFDVIIEFPLPGPKEREDMLVDTLGEFLAGDSVEMVKRAARRLDNFTGAHITEFAERLKLAAFYAGLKHVTKEIFDKELREFGFRPMKKNRGEQPMGFVTEA